MGYRGMRPARLAGALFAQLVVRRPTPSPYSPSCFAPHADELSHPLHCTPRPDGGEARPPTARPRPGAARQPRPARGAGAKCTHRFSPAPCVPLGFTQRPLPCRSPGRRAVPFRSACHYYCCPRALGPPHRPLRGRGAAAAPVLICGCQKKPNQGFPFRFLSPRAAAPAHRGARAALRGSAAARPPRPNPPAPLIVGGVGASLAASTHSDSVPAPPKTPVPRGARLSIYPCTLSAWNRTPRAAFRRAAPGCAGTKTATRGRPTHRSTRGVRGPRGEENAPSGARVEKRPPSWGCGICAGLSRAALHCTARAGPPARRAGAGARASVVFDPPPPKARRGSDRPNARTTTPCVRSP
ncbi:hypothetical protein Rsub_05995 [Raphidocelis subcapitata]|uniref:Uncharacterized protein n=1 Tax=Raphidocelis subcapitata TaxID=307507 RepID=A0A2V0P5X1_9CHLO|nr:hypothetical protein Rsub_05995 [Raphidocelis subcapitata]|eukprot:GBF93263.1 hypothetical protein Rsub_05995 [Raphidocelis subcapitata]